MSAEDSVTPEEREAAERLREALEGSLEGVASKGSDPESLAAARLLLSLGAAGVADDVAARRLRNEVVSLARRNERTRRYRFPVAAGVAAALLLAAGGLFYSRQQAVDANLLASRERAAHEALARIDGSWNDSRLGALAEWRQEELARAYRIARFEELLKKRTEELLESRNVTGSTPNPTPGGAS